MHVHIRKSLIYFPLKHHEQQTWEFTRSSSLSNLSELLFEEVDEDMPAFLRNRIEGSFEAESAVSLNGPEWRHIVFACGRHVANNISQRANKSLERATGTF